MRLILAAAGVLFLCSASLTQEAPKAEPAPSQVVKHRKVVHRFGVGGDQIRQALAGNTILGIENGKEYSEYFLPGGFIRGRDSDGPYTGQWVIRGA